MLTAAEELLADLLVRGVTLVPDGERLRFRPRSAVTANLLARLQEHKIPLLALLKAVSAAAVQAPGRPAPSRPQVPSRVTGSTTLAQTLPSFVSAQTVFIDVETQSACDIKLGGRRYAADPTTRILSVVALVDGMYVVWAPSTIISLDPALLRPAGEPKDLNITVCSGRELPPALLAALHAGRPFCAHNADGFDAHVWRAQGLPEPCQWIDTLHCARAAGLPGRLEDVARRLFGEGKDEQGKKLIRALSRVSKTGELPDVSIEQLVEIIRYNIQDVALLAKIYGELADYGEPGVVAVDRTINNRGVAFDADLARQLIRLEHEAHVELGRKLEDLTYGEIGLGDLSRTAFLAKWLAEKGMPLANLQKVTVALALESCPSDQAVVRAVLEGRLATARISTSKLETALAAIGTDGRLGGLLVYHGAHTGRFTGRLVQPQNLPRPDGRIVVDELITRVHSVEAFQAALPAGCSFADGLAACIRPCFRARPGHVLCVADFASIEARGLAWCASEQRLLDLFDAGADTYCAMASQIFGRAICPADKRERAIGKVAVLGCGYGMGPELFAKTCRDLGVDLATAGTTADEVVEVYRNSWPAIAGIRNGARKWREGGLWNNVERAARSAICSCAPVEAGNCRFGFEDGHLKVQLPSGRQIVYRNSRLSTPVNGRSAGITFDHPTRPNETTYSGKLTENIVSAICRDLLVAALVECEGQNLPVVLHVHDEIVLEVPEEHADASLNRLLLIMSTPPAWAAGFPIEVEGFYAERYFKSPPAGSRSIRARNGKILPSERKDWIVANHAMAG